MLAPEIIEKNRRKREEKEDSMRPTLRLPLPMPEIRHPDEVIEQEEKTDRIVIIDMA
jgi:hypothetical protein